MSTDKTERADYALLTELAGIDCYDTNLRDQPAAYEALERYRAALPSQPATVVPVAHDLLAPVPYDKHEAEMLEVIDERDRYHDMADQLAAQIAAITGEDIGEHASDNDPWHNAMLAADEWIARDLRAMFAGEVEPYWKAFRARLSPSAPAESGWQPTDAARDVLAERRRQISAEGWTPGHDDEHTKGEIAVAAALYALRRKADPMLWVTSGSRPGWAANFLEDVEAWVKPCDPRRSLVKAGALVLAEIERLDRAALKAAPSAAQPGGADGGAS